MFLRFLRRAAMLGAVLLIPIDARAADFTAEFAAMTRECIELARDLTRTKPGPDWVMVEDRAIDWEDDPTTSLQRRGLHARLPIRMDAKARYVTDSGAIMYSNCLLVPAGARDMDAAPAGKLGYGPEASIGAEEMEAAARAVFAQLLREAHEDGTDLSRRTTPMDPPFAALRDCAAPGVLLEFAVTRPPSLWPWTVSAVRRPKGPVGCPGR